MCLVTSFCAARSTFLPLGVSFLLFRHVRLANRGGVRVGEARPNRQNDRRYMSTWCKRRRGWSCLAIGCWFVCPWLCPVFLPPNLSFFRLPVHVLSESFASSSILHQDSAAQSNQDMLLKDTAVCRLRLVALATWPLIWPLTA